jgi:hypothetical protein
MNKKILWIAVKDSLLLLWRGWCDFSGVLFLIFVVLFVLKKIIAI